MELTEQIDHILGDLITIAGKIDTADMGKPTPCAKFAVRDVFDHMIGGASQFAPQLRGETPGELPALTDDNRKAEFERAMRELGAAVKAPGAMSRTVVLPFGEVPGEVLAKFLTVDGMTHGWDLTRATGLPYDPPADLAEEVLATAQALIAPEMRDGDTFAAATEVAADAPAVDRLAAFTGRAV
jgi:uncharacterized protein (TIGR03086 family)